MNRLHTILRDMALFTVPVCGAFLVWCLWPARAALQDNAKGTAALIAKASTTLDGVNATLASVNRLCPGPKDPIRPCGVLADVNRTLATLRGTAGQVEIAAIHENAQLGTLDAQERELVADVHTTLASASGTAQAATAALGTVNADLVTANASIAAAKPLLDASTLAVGHVDALATSADVARFLKASADTSVQFSLISAEGAGIAKDIHKEADTLTAPKPWYQKVGNGATTGVNIACLVTHSCPF